MKELNSKHFTLLTTERLTLRQLKNIDDCAISLLHSDDRVNKYIERPKQKSIVEAKAFITRINKGIKQNKWIYKAICLKGSQGLIGTICVWKFSDDKLTAELGYELNPANQGKGLMNEAVTCIIKFSFETLGIKTLEAFVHKDNTKSAQLLVKNNFKLDRNRKDKENKNNLIFTLTNK